VTEYIKRDEERLIRELLDEMADGFGLYSPKKEKFFSGYYLDRLWSKELEGEKVPFVAFEIEKGVPSNERIRKDIMNVACTKAPKGYVILPHRRILEDPKARKGGNWASWYKSNFEKTFSIYRQLFAAYCDIEIIDADMLLASRSLHKSVVSVP